MGRQTSAISQPVGSRLLANADEKTIRKKRYKIGERSLVEHGWDNVQAGITLLAEIRHATGGLRAGDWSAAT